VPTVAEQRLPVGLGDGTDDEPAPSDQGDRGALLAGQPGEKAAILDELCATAGWHRNHVRKALGQGLVPRVVPARRPRVPKYGQDVVASLRFCWAGLGRRRVRGSRRDGRAGRDVATFR
jgi:hypothetical protein